MFCLCRFSLIFTSININLCKKKGHFLLLLFLKIVFHWQKTYFKNELDFFLNITVTYFSYASLSYDCW